MPCQPTTCTPHPLPCGHLPAADGEESVQDVWASELAGGSGGGGGSASGISIVAADVRDPYVLLHLSDGSAALLAADAASCRLAPVPAAVLQPTGERNCLTACSLYADSCGWLQQHAAGGAAAAAGSSASNPSSSAGGLYCLVCRASGACQVYALPTWQPVFSAANLAEGPAVLAASGSSSTAAQADDPGLVTEARLACFGPVAAGRSDPAAARASKAPACQAPLLLALTADHQLLAYRAFSVGGSGGSSSTRLAFRRLPLDVPPVLPPAAGLQQQEAEAQQPWRLQRLHCFEGLGEEAPYSGLFVAGAAQAAGCGGQEAFL